MPLQRAEPAPAAGAGSAGATGQAEELIVAAVGLAESGQTLLLADDIRTALDSRATDPELAAEFDRALGHIESGAPESGPIAPLSVAAGDIVWLLERRFILNPKRSTLDLLGPAQSRRYRRFKWDTFDFPGKVPGPNEARAREMIRALSQVRPERRANSTADAVIVESEVDRDLERDIRKQFVPVEGQAGHQLHPEAAASFVRMRAAAAGEGVRLRILDADRKFEHSRKRAAKAGHPQAIADFSTHNLGLAVDLWMSTRRKSFREARTTPFGKLVEMHESPAHKWMLLRGEAFGWYPFKNEPWHWEYNPAGFRERFRASIGLPPEDETAAARPPEPVPTAEGADTEEPAEAVG